MSSKPQRNAPAPKTPEFTYRVTPAQFADRFLVSSYDGVVKMSFGEFTAPRNDILINHVVAMTKADARDFALTILSHVQPPEGPTPAPQRP
jgi:hypothetical protein